MKYFFATILLSSLAFAEAKPTTDTLYKRLGGKSAIKKVIDEFVSNCASDTRLDRFFDHLKKDTKKLAAFKTHLVDQVCSASGGPCKYKGRNMKTTHTGWQITENDFNLVVEALTKALDKYKVGEKEKSELLNTLAAMKGDIVSK